MTVETKIFGTEMLPRKKGSQKWPDVLGLDFISERKSLM